LRSHLTAYLLSRHASLAAVVALPILATSLLCAAGCDSVAPPHPAVGRTVGDLPLLALADPARRPPTFTGKVTLLNFWGTWCPPCRRELPGLARLADRLKNEAAFQLIAVSCGSGGPDDAGRLAASTNAFLAEERLSVDAWGDPDGRVRQIFASAYGFQAFPTTYLIGPDATVRQVWVGYRSRDETDIALAIVALLKKVTRSPAAAVSAAR